MKASHVVYHIHDRIVLAYADGEENARKMASALPNHTYCKMPWTTRIWHLLLVRFGRAL